jgi:hypothetical protein
MVQSGSNQKGFKSGRAPHRGSTISGSTCASGLLPRHRFCRNGSAAPRGNYTAAMAILVRENWSRLTRYENAR